MDNFIVKLCFNIEAESITKEALADHIDRLSKDIRSGDTPLERIDIRQTWTWILMSTDTHEPVACAREMPLVVARHEPVNSSLEYWCRSDLTKSSPVLAHVCSDDHLVERTVDIRPFLMDTADRGSDMLECYLHALKEEDWAFGETSDEVYLGLADQDPGCAALDAYLSLNPRSITGDQVGFSVSVDEDHMMHWLQKNIPEIYKKMTEDQG